MTNMPTSGPVAAAKSMTGGLLNIVGKFIIPIAAAGMGWATGRGACQAIGDFVIRFVPGMMKVEAWVNAKEGSIWIGLIIGAAIVLMAAVMIGMLAKSFLGDTIWGEMVFRAVIGYGIGAALSAAVHGFGPAKAALDQAGVGT